MLLKKSQAGIEFTVLIGFMMFVFVMIFFALSDNIGDANQKDQKRKVYELADYLDNEIRLASLVEDGYYKELQLPGTIDGMNYNININPYNPGTGPENSNNSEVIIYLQPDSFIGSENFTVVRFYYQTHINLTKGCNIINKTSGEVRIFPMIDSSGNPINCDGSCVEGYSC
ncbi:MAG: hypothetical protein ACLFPQ_06650 [Candidatus Woesearchaeota archaeon]